MLLLHLTFQKTWGYSWFVSAADEEVTFALPEGWRNTHKQLRIATAHRGCWGLYATRTWWPGDVWSLPSVPGGLGGKKKTITNLPCTFLFQQWWRHYRELASLAPFIKSVGRARLTGRRCPRLYASTCAALFFWDCVLNCDSDYDNDSYHSLKLALFLALS